MKDEIYERWEVLLEELNKIKAKAESVVLVGDLNLHCGSIVKENHEKTTIRGKLLRNLLKNKDYVLVNATDKTIGGPFTRYDRTDPSNDGKKSLLDYFIVSSSISKYIDSLEIDNKFGQQEKT